MKSVPSVSPHTNDVTGENTFVTSTLSDIIKDWLDEINTTFDTITVVLTQTTVDAKRTAEYFSKIYIKYALIMIGAFNSLMEVPFV